MVYEYINFPDGTEVVHTQILNEDANPTVEVHFERPTSNGFDSARCELPSYKWLFNEGYSEEELSFFNEFLHHNAHLIFRYAATGGLQIA